ncbi:hypothetical protein [Polyangium aurulentum]|uniref:hypothetical protein n=1 Tax=Polyangium aurulentum TaxID=2567896 RepID=UPI00146C4F51|nr:hypothetical protein [Polyangium aurulentum]UQA60425.1 hypothetical protein E8A73_008105 [Polyangium aurulentum]
MCARGGAPLACAEVLVPVRLAPGPELAGLGDDRPALLELLDLAPAGIERRGLIEAPRARGAAPGEALVLREGLDRFWPRRALPYAEIFPGFCAARPRSA